MRRTSLLTIWCLLLGSLTILADPAAPVAGAAVTSEQQAFWGLQTKGASGTVARWDALGWAIEQIDGTMYVGGNFLETTNGSTTVNQPYLAAFDADGGRYQSWFTPDVGNAVFSLEASPDGGLFVGGEINSWNGSTIGALAKIDPVTGELWPGWSTRIYGGSSTIRDLKVEDDGYLYIVGNFSTASHAGVAQSASGAVRVDPITGAIDSTWKPQATGGSVWGVSRSKTNGLIYLAGHFDYINGQTGTGGFVGLDNNANVIIDRSPVPLNNCANIGYCTEMYDVEATDQGTVWVGGVEHSLYMLDENNSYDMVLHHFTNCARNYSASCERRGGEYQEIEVGADGYVYASCHCWNDHISHTSMIPWSSYPIGTYTGEISAFAKYDPATGQRDQSFNPYMSGKSGGFGIHVNTDDGCVWVTGGINSVGTPGNQSPGRGLARLCDPAIPNNNTPPVTPTAAPCTVTVNGTNVTVDWTAVDSATNYVVRRSANGGNASWRGSSATTSFDDTISANNTYTYMIEAKFLANQTGTPATCTPDVEVATPDPITAPVSCSAAIVGDTIQVTWPAVADATDYVVYRSVDGGLDYWRGKTQTASFSDSRKPNTTLSYSVLAVDQFNLRSAKTTCNPAINDVPTPIAAPATCTAAIVGDSIQVNWTGVPTATDYTVYRNVDGGTDHWRGKSQTTSFTDSRKPNRTLTYSVLAIDAAGTKSPKTTCSPNLVDVPTPPVAPANCTAAVVGTDIVVTWAASADATDYVIRRSVDGGSSFWRGKVQTTSFTDSIRTGVTLQYSVIAIDGSGMQSATTVCGPDLTL